MSTFDNKVIATRDFLRNRASLKRLTSYEEVQRAVGIILASRGQRSTAAPVSRGKIVEVLAQIDEASFADKGIIPSALVVHFWDNEPGHRFAETATKLGLEPEGVDVHAQQVQKAFEQYQDTFYPVDMTPEVPNDLSELDEETSDSDY